MRPLAIASSTTSTGLRNGCPVALWQSKHSMRRGWYLSSSALLSLDSASKYVTFVPSGFFTWTQGIERRCGSGEMNSTSLAMCQWMPVAFHSCSRSTPDEVCSVIR